MKKIVKWKYKATTEGIEMPFVGPVNKGFIDMVAESVRQIVPLLDPDVLYESPELCALCSRPLSPSQQKLAGHCLRYLVTTEQVPLLHMGQRSNRHHIYRVIPSDEN